MRIRRRWGVGVLVVTASAGLAWSGAVPVAATAPASAAAPSAPTSVTATGVSHTAVDLAWTVPAGATGVLIRRAVGNVAPAFPTAGQFVTDAPATRTTYRDPGRTPGTTYAYAFFAYDAARVHSTAATATATATPPAWGPARTIDPYRGRLKAVSCPSTTFCMALDDAGFALRFNGRTWTRPTRIQVAEEEFGFADVSCRSSSFCLAVDSTGNVFGYNGLNWSAPQHLAPHLVSVSCGSTTMCMAVGINADATVWRVYRYNGASWDAGRAVTSFSSTVNGISCAGPTFCMALVEDGSGADYAVRWDGAGWTRPVKVNSGGWSRVMVSCSSPQFCIAVEDYVSYIRWDGVRWSAPANYVRPEGYTAMQISCARRTLCMVVGGAVPGRAFAVRWTGSGWTSPTLNSAYDGNNRVSCVGSTFCMAVDDWGNAQRWNGSGWSAPLPIDPTRGGLLGVSCPSVTFCMAFDQWANVLRFDGATWTAPRRIGSSRLQSMACTSSTFCMAIDQYGRALRYNGAGWVGPMLTHIGRGPVSCSSAKFCVVLDAQGRTARWDGTRWGSVATTFPGAWSYSAVSCKSNRFCTALTGGGRVSNFDGTGWSRIVRVDPYAFLNVTMSCGAAWRCVVLDSAGRTFQRGATGWVRMPNANGNLQHLSCTSVTFCAAVGSGGNWQVYNGTAWNPWGEFTTAVPGSELTGLSCATSTFCVATDRAHVYVAR